MEVLEPQGKVVDTAVRLVCRYSNGLTQNTVARGVSMTDGVLRVLVRETYEVGVKLTVMASFLSKMSPGQVTGVERATEPGAYFVDVRLRPSTVSPGGAPALVEQEGKKSAKELKTAARTLANRLEEYGRIPYYNAAFEQALMSERPGILAATEVAVFTLLQERGLAAKSLMMDMAAKGSR